MTWDEANAIRQCHAEALSKRPGVVGVRIGKDINNAPCLVLHVDVDLNIAGLPKVIDGLPVRVERTGPAELF